MKITFLGTGTSQGVPIIGSDHPVCLSDDPRDKRLRCSAMVEWDGANYVIDCGPDFRMQMIQNKIQKIDALFFTHEHTDHIIGLDDIRPFFYKQQCDIPIYAEPNVMEALERRFHYILDTSHNYPGKPRVAAHLISPDTPITINHHEIVPIRVMHSQLPIVGYKFHKLIYLTDVKTVPDASLHYFQDVEILVVNALREQEHHGHFTLQEALAFIEKVQPKKAYLTHVSHLLGFHEEVSKALPDNVFLAHDGLTLEIPS